MNWNTLKATSIDEVIAWAEPQEWCQAMAQCVQDAHWHAEGDVWTHTQMVLRELPKLEEWNSLSSHQQTVLKFTALFHDMAKPRSIEVDSTSGRVRTPKHSLRGEHQCRHLLRMLDCDFSTREEIAKMVRFHGRPAFLLERENPTLEVVRLSWFLNNRLLYLFTLADSRGRVTKTGDRPEESLHFWKMMAEEAGCFQTRYPFTTDHSRFVFFHHQNPDLYYVPHEDFRCTVTMMSGLPGSGKDAWLQENRPGVPMVSLDEMREQMGVDPKDNQGRVIQAAREKCKDFMRSKQSFAFNATNLVSSTRKIWTSMFSDYGCRIEMVYLEPRWNQLLRQNKSRAKAVPEKVMVELARKAEPAHVTECHELFIACHDD